MSAEISNCKRYRYWVNIQAKLQSAKSKGSAVFVLLHPTLDALGVDKEVLKQCEKTAKLMGYDGVRFINLYALMAEELKELEEPAAWREGVPTNVSIGQHDYLIGPHNDLIIKTILKAHDNIICAWGKHASPYRVNEFLKFAKDAGVKLWCYGTDIKGAPLHPLQIEAIAATERLIPFNKYRSQSTQVWPDKLEQDVSKYQGEYTPDPHVDNMMACIQQLSKKELSDFKKQFTKQDYIIYSQAKRFLQLQHGAHK